MNVVKVISKLEVHWTTREWYVILLTLIQHYGFVNLYRILRELKIYSKN